MTQYSTGPDAPATPDAIRDAYLAGLAHGIARGAVMAMTPDQQHHDQRRQARIAGRRAAADRAAARLPRKPTRQFWPDLMPGGWPIPPTIPSDDPADWWPEVDGWPCPPPALRGGNA